MDLRIPDFGSRRITTRMAPWIDAALAKHLPGEETHWETMVLPGEQGVQFAIIVWLPSPVLGEHMQGLINLHNPIAMDSEEMDRYIAEFARQMKEARSQMLAQQAGAGQQAHQGRPERPTMSDLARKAVSNGS